MAGRRNVFGPALRANAFEKKLMGIRSKIAMLPAAMRTELDRLIVERAFSGYQALAQWLQAQAITSVMIACSATESACAAISTPSISRATRPWRSPPPETALARPPMT
jgi:hypothetical protein